MSIFTSLLLAFAVAMDAFAVAVASGSVTPRLRWSEALRIAVLFGFFQALMPVIGWSVGLNFKDLIVSYDHWVAFGLLTAVGGKMIYDDLKGGNDDEESVNDAFGSVGIGSLLILALATSIDALAVGFSLTFLNSIFLPVFTVGAVTFVMSLAGVYLGHRFKHFGRNRARIIGGLILIGIGIKILIEDLSLLP